LLHYNFKLHYGLIIIIFVAIVFPINFAYGHGIGFETISGIEIGKKEISLTVEIPIDFEGSENTQITISAIDDKTDENIENLTLLISLFNENEMIMKDSFFTPNGNLKINVLSNSDDEIKIQAHKDSSLDAWIETESQPIQLSGPIFITGGLYHFEIEILTIDDPTNKIKDLGIFIADINTITTSSYTEKNSAGEDVSFKMKSYFDKISNFEYDADKKIIIFEMPFDWNEKTVSHIPVVHKEVHFPKNYAEFLTPSYTGKVNGIDLFKSSIMVDDYSDDDERIVHLILLQDHLKFLKQQQKKSGELPNYIQFTLKSSEQFKFPMIGMTTNEEIQVDLSWDPITIEPDIPTKFIFTFRDSVTENPLRQTSYDFVIIQNGVEMYRTSDVAVIGGAFEDFTFSESQTGPIIVKFENIGGADLETEFGLVVIPEFGALTIMIFVTSMIIVVTVMQTRFSKIHFH